MKSFYLIPLIVFVVCFSAGASPAWSDANTPRLEIVAQLKQRPGNIAVAADGRMFVSIHPFDMPTYKVMEVKADGSAKPYPDEVWAREPGADGRGLSRVIHLAIVGQKLYILDMGSVRHQAKLVAWDVAQNKLTRVWYIPSHVVTAQSFLQDFVITPDEKYAVIADMGQADLTGRAQPGFIALNLNTGMAERKLDGHPSVRPPAIALKAAGASVLYSQDGRDLPLFMGLNPITIDPSGDWIYYGPMGEGKLYRIHVKDILDETMSSDDLAKKIETVGNKPASDGILVDAMKNVFVASLNDGAIGVINDKGKYSTWLRDPLMSWPDGLAFGPDGGIYVTTNQLHLAPAFNKGEEKSTPPYMVLRLMGGRPMPEKTSIIPPTLK